MDFLAALIQPDQVQAWFEWGGYFILFGLLFACGLGLPLPEDIPLLLAGIFIAAGKMNWPHAAVLAWCGIIGGDCILYRLGWKFGPEITRVPFIGKHVTRERIKHAEHLFARWGVWVVAVGRLFAGIRGAMVVAAGTARFSFIKFIIADGLAALVSGGLFMCLGYWGAKKLGGNLSEILKRAGAVKEWVFGALGLIVILIILYAWWRHRRHKTLADVALEKAEEVADHAPARSADNQA